MAKGKRWDSASHDFVRMLALLKQIHGLAESHPILGDQIGSLGIQASRHLDFLEVNHSAIMAFHVNLDTINRNHN